MPSMKTIITTVVIAAVVVYGYDKYKGGLTTSGKGG